MFKRLGEYLVKPSLYAPGTASLWDDEHISRGMLDAHLNPNWDAASRNHAFLDKSADWIAHIAPPCNHKFLLDLGCGPGLYAERFNRAGYSVTGVDFSKRSISYAKARAYDNGHDIEYYYQNYLTINFVNQFDVITLIYCDYAALSKTDRLMLLTKIHQALKPNGKFILDVFTPLMRKPEGRSWEYFENGGFYSKQQHLCLHSVYQYDDDDRTELRQCIVQTDNSIDCYNIWDHFFTKEAFVNEIQSVNFTLVDVYGDIAGKKFMDTGETVCGVFTK